jgi:hypothetical protein
MKLSSGRAAKTAPASPAFDPVAPDGVLRLIAAMCWPKDPLRQAEAVTTWHLEAMADARHVAPFVQEMGQERATIRLAAAMGLDPERLRFMPWTAADVGRRADPEAAYRSAMASLRNVPGWEKVAADAPGTARLRADMDAAGRSGAFVAGQLLLLVAVLYTHRPQTQPSLRRAMAILVEAKRRNPSLPIPDPRHIKEIWKEWRCVAPLWAAMRVASEYRAEMAPPLSVADAATEVLLMPNGRVAILGMAAWFRDFGIGFKPKHAVAPLLREEECAAMPVAPVALEPPLECLVEWAEEAARRTASSGRYGWNVSDWD